MRRIMKITWEGRITNRDFMAKQIYPKSNSQTENKMD